MKTRILDVGLRLNPDPDPESGSITLPGIQELMFSQFKFGIYPIRTIICNEEATVHKPFIPNQTPTMCARAERWPRGCFTNTGTQK